MAPKLRHNSQVTFVLSLIAIVMVVLATAVRAQVGNRSYTAAASSALNHANGSHLAATHQRSGGASPMLGAAPVFLPMLTYDMGGCCALGMVAADFNADGDSDMAVINGGFYGYSVGILLGNGHGWFEPPVNYYDWDWGWDSGELPWSVAVGDLNGDGRPDLVVSMACDWEWACPQGGVVVLLGNGDGTFQPLGSYGTGAAFASSVAVADVNDDGKPDVVVANQCPSGQWVCEQRTVVAVLLGNGDGTLQPAATYGGGSGLPDYMFNSLAVADVNGDGWLDMLVATGGANYGTVALLLGNGDGTFGTAVDIDAGSDVFAVDLSVGDVNGDSKPDIITGNWCGAGDCVLSVLLGNGDGTFQAPVLYGSGGGYPSAIAIADVNGDGKADLVTQNASGDCGILSGNGDGTFQPAIDYRVGKGSIYGGGRSRC